jgi:protease-4
MSAAAREANLSWIGVLWGQYRDTIVKQRNISPQSFQQYANQYDEVLARNGNDSAQMAVKEGLVDAIISRKAWREEMQSIVGASESTYNHVSLKSYLLATRPPIPVFDPAAKKIAVITASGTIYDGVQPAGDIGGDSISKLIRAARNNDQVKALVVRIDSPGGSAAASELIRSELELTQDEGKPVVVSMSGYAASGGYWIASTANKIFSADTTVTGSIGTFVIFPTFEESLSELGIHSDGVGTTTLSGAFNAFQEINPVLQKSLEHSVRHTYQKFIGLVAQGREMPVEDVDKIAQGRVWAGTTAVKLGLVDAIGNLQDAINSAAMLADVEDYEILYLEQELTTTERLLNQFLGSSLKAVHAATGGISNQWHILGKVSQDLNAILEMSQSPGIYLQCVYCKVY